MHGVLTLARRAVCPTGVAALGQGLAWRALALALVCAPVLAQPAQDSGGRRKRLREVVQNQRENAQAKVSEESLGAHSAHLQHDAFGGREMLVYLPARLPEPGTRGLLVALHGGGGNAQFMRDHLKIDGVAEKHGFIVAYLEGSAATDRLGGGRLKAWNAGSGCCGKPAADNVDDVAYIGAAVKYLQQKYGVAGSRTVGVGHSNGAMMGQTLACVSEVFSAVASLAGTLMADNPHCPTARGHTIYNYHGSDDQNVPPAGGYGRKGVTHILFTSQAQAQARFEAAGGRYLLKTLAGADHAIEHLSQALQRTEGQTIGERVARDLGLAAP